MNKLMRSLLTALLLVLVFGPWRANAQTLNCTPPADDPEIVALARALKYDARLIYEYVYYNIEYSPVFGARRSPLETYLDGRGTQVDQNVLFFELLQQSCISAFYTVSSFTYTGAEIANLFGIPNDAAVMLRVLGNGGFSGSVNPTSGPVSTVGHTGPLGIWLTTKANCEAFSSAADGFAASLRKSNCSCL